MIPHACCPSRRQRQVFCLRLFRSDSDHEADSAETSHHIPEKGKQNDKHLKKIHDQTLKHKLASLHWSNKDTISSKLQTQ
jgi:hypothetical protein